MGKGDRLYIKALKEAQKEKPDNFLAKRLLLKAIAMENGKAEYALGTWYLYGKVVEKDLTKAIELLEAAANKNVPEAHFDLAVCFETGQGFKQDFKKAFLHYTNAALLGDKQSIAEIAKYYYFGTGVEKDTELANLWYDMADHYGVDI